MIISTKQYVTSTATWIHSLAITTEKINANDQYFKTKAIGIKIYYRFV